MLSRYFKLCLPQLILGDHNVNKASAFIGLSLPPSHIICNLFDIKFSFIKLLFWRSYVNFFLRYYFYVMVKDTAYFQSIPSLYVSLVLSVSTNSFVIPFNSFALPWHSPATVLSDMSSSTFSPAERGRWGWYFINVHHWKKCFNIYKNFSIINQSGLYKYIPIQLLQCIREHYIVKWVIMWHLIKTIR